MSVALCVGDHTLLLVVQKLYSFGINTYGQLCCGDTSASAGLRAASCFESVPVFRCAITASASLVLTPAGLHICGRLANGATHATPLHVDLAGTIRLISSGDTAEHVLLFGEAGLVAMGSNLHGELGVGDFVQRSGPTPVLTLSEKQVTHVGVGQGFSAVVSEGRLYTFGHAKLVGCRTERDLVQPRVVGFFVDRSLYVTNISCGRSATVVACEDGSLYFFGRGFNSPVYQRVPAVFRPFERPVVAVQVAVGGTHVLVVCEDNSGATRLYTCGTNSYGELGIASTFGSTRPTAVQCDFFDQSTIDTIAAGNTVSFALLATGELLSWGERFLGKLGHAHGTGEACTVPAVVDEASQILKSAGYDCLRSSLVDARRVERDMFATRRNLVVVEGEGAVRNHIDVDEATARNALSEAIAASYEEAVHRVQSRKRKEEAAERIEDLISLEKQRRNALEKAESKEAERLLTALETITIETSLRREIFDEEERRRADVVLTFGPKGFVERKEHASD